MDFDNNDNITRRKFIKGVAGATACCACFSLYSRAGAKDNSVYKIKDNNKFKDGEAKVHLAAACGTYCGACPAYINKHGEGEVNFPTEPINDTIDYFVSLMDGLQCDGCLSGGTLAGHCQSCNIRLHAASTQDDDRCTDCEQLPCYRITNLINQGNYPHRQEYLPNLAKIKEMGVQDWILYEEDRWNCSQCGRTLSWYDTRCTGCGASRSKDLFALFETEPTNNMQPVYQLLLEE